MAEYSGIIYPLIKAQTYTLGQLRATESELLASRQNDPKLSARLRAQKRNEIDWAKTRNEELYPLKLLADFLGWADNITFKWTPNGAADFEILGSNITASIQCTMAYKKYADVSGGHLHHKETEHLNAHGFSFYGGKPDTPTVRDSADDLTQWQVGISEAIGSKLDKPSYADRDDLSLLVYARGCVFDNIDSSFEDVVSPAIDLLTMSDWRTYFKKIYVVDDGGFAHF